MKKFNIKYYVYILFAQLIIISCNDNETAIDYDFTGNISIDESTVTLFDDNYDLSITFSPTSIQPNVSLENVEIFKGFPGGVSVGNTTINNNKAIVNTSLFGSFSEDFEIEAVATLSNGKIISRGFTITVTNAGELIIENIKGSTVSELAFQSPDTLNVIMKNISLNYQNALEMLEWRKSSLGTYSQESFSFNNNENDTLKLEGMNSVFNKYAANIGDTLYFRYILDNSITKDTLVSKIAIISQYMGDSKSIVFGNDDVTELNFATGEATDFEVSYVNPASLLGSNASGIMFVKSSSSEEDKNKLFTKGDLFDAKNEFDLGTQTAALNNVLVNDLFIYKIDRDGETIYGLLKIGDIINSNTNIEKINTEYKEGKFL